MLDNPSILPGYEDEIEMIRMQSDLTVDELIIINEIKEQYDSEIKELVLGCG